MIIMNCGEKIKKYRTELGITQKELARRAQIATVSVQQYEAGVRNPKIETLCRIASGLDVPVDAIRSDLDLESFSTAIGKRIVATVDDEPMIYAYHKLNSDGQIKVIEYAEDLAGNPEYRKDTE